MRIVLVTLMLGIASGLSGCQSEIDKCVNAEVKAWEAKLARIEQDVATGRKKYSQSVHQDAYAQLYDDSIVKKDERSKAEVEADVRRRCLQISGKAQ